MCKKYLIILCMLIICGVTNINAQIGYQVSLLNSATGEPRANEMMYPIQEQVAERSLALVMLNLNNRKFYSSKCAGV